MWLDQANIKTLHRKSKHCDYDVNCFDRNIPQYLKSILSKIYHPKSFPCVSSLKSCSQESTHSFQIKTAVARHWLLLFILVSLRLLLLWIIILLLLLLLLFLLLTCFLAATVFLCATESTVLREDILSFLDWCFFDDFLLLLYQTAYSFSLILMLVLVPINRVIYWCWQCMLYFTCDYCCSTDLLNFCWFRICLILWWFWSGKKCLFINGNTDNVSPYLSCRCAES